MPKAVLQAGSPTRRSGSLMVASDLTLEVYEGRYLDS
jgi:hypothetical protein